MKFKINPKIKIPIYTFMSGFAVNIPAAWMFFERIHQPQVIKNIAMELFLASVFIIMLWVMGDAVRRIIAIIRRNRAHESGMVQVENRLMGSVLQNGADVCIKLPKDNNEMAGFFILGKDEYTKTM